MNYTGIYVGVVVQNNDPENRGRVKVYVPHVNAAVYENWYNVKKNKSFRFAGRNIDSDLGDIMSDLKNILPWADQASPIGSQAATGRYNAYTDTGSVSDSNTLTNFTSVSGHVSSKYALNTEGIGEKPARKYETEQMRLNDAFSSADYGAETGVRRPNKYSYNYRPSSYSNSAKGVFGIPNVGAHVWCFFHDGDPNNPIYFAAAFGQQDWESVFGNTDTSGVDYPGAYENQTVADSDVADINTETYRNKFLINQKGGTLEFVNTDNREILKMTHYSGSFKEFNNHTTVELAANNDQKLVLHDQYLTVNGYGGWFVGRDLEHIIKGDHFLRVGHQNTPLHRAWREKARELHHVKQLFETQRADTSANINVIDGALVSPLQTKSGSNSAPCPVCNPSANRGDKLWDLNETYSSIILCETRQKKDNEPSKDANIVGDDVKTAATVAAATDGGGSIFSVSQSCPSCGGGGSIQGSMDGTWAVEQRKTDWLNTAKQVIGELADIEASLGMGGSEIVNVAKHKTETIGLVMNDFGSVRVDTEGKYYKNGVQVLKGGVVNTRVVSPLVEYVHVDDLPGGSYTLNVCNRWNVQVGAGGVSMKSYGPVDIGGTITNIGGTQVNIGSENEINIDGGNRVNIVADILTLRQRDGKQVLVDSNLGVTKNVVIGGGLHVEGELTCNHITAPVEIQETELLELWGKSEWDKTLVIGYIDDGKVSDKCGNKKCPPTKVYSRLTTAEGYEKNHYAEDNSTRMEPHSHYFKNVPLNLKKKNVGVRTVALNAHDGDRIAPSDRKFVQADLKAD